MLVPKAAVHEQDSTPLREHQIRSARQIPTMQTEPESARVKRATHGQFWLRPLRADTRHDPGANVGRNGVGHSIVSTALVAVHRQPWLSGEIPMSESVTGDLGQSSAYTYSFAPRQK